MSNGVRPPFADSITPPSRHGTLPTSRPHIHVRSRSTCASSSSTSFCFVGFGRRTISTHTARRPQESYGPGAGPAWRINTHHFSTYPDRTDVEARVDEPKDGQCLSHVTLRRLLPSRTSPRPHRRQTRCSTCILFAPGIEKQHTATARFHNALH